MADHDALVAFAVARNDVGQVILISLSPWRGQVPVLLEVSPIRRGLRIDAGGSAIGVAPREAALDLMDAWEVFFGHIKGGVVVDGGMVEVRWVDRKADRHG